jgi:hypothetical protein
MKKKIDLIVWGKGRNEVPMTKRGLAQKKFLGDSNIWSTSWNWIEEWIQTSSNNFYSNSELEHTSIQQKNAWQNECIKQIYKMLN